MELEDVHKHQQECPHGTANVMNKIQFLYLNNITNCKWLSLQWKCKGEREREGREAAGI